MALLDNIRFTRDKINSLYSFGVKYKWFGPEAPLIIRCLFYLLRPTPLAEKRSMYIDKIMNQFYREYSNLQRASIIPPAFWNSTILNKFEEYILSNKAVSLEECISLYRDENSEDQTESWELVYLEKIR